MISAEQIKAARALLRMEQDELARRAGVSVTTIRRLEAASDDYAVSESTAQEVRMVLQEAGVDFILDGVRLKQDRPGADELFDRLYRIAGESASLLGDRAPFAEADLYGDDGLPA
jgi:transcriptional regulator with XRE-family HTH domain